MLKDRHGDETQVMFHLGRSARFDPRPFVVGHTIAVFYAEMHGFLDTTTGLRVEPMLDGHGV